MSRAAAAPTTLIHLTDTHLVAPGLQHYGLDPRARLDAAIADINSHHADAELAVVTGDLTHAGEPDAYCAFRESMAALRIPHALVGNHGRRTACLELLPTAPREEDGFVQGTRDTDVGRLVFLDTSERCRPDVRAALGVAPARLPRPRPPYRSSSSCITPRFRIGIPDMGIS